jgi:hypothetical protein
MSDRKKCRLAGDSRSSPSEIGLNAVALRMSDTQYNSASHLMEIEFLHGEVLWGTKAFDKLPAREIVARENVDITRRTSKPGTKDPLQTAFSH